VADLLRTSTTITTICHAFPDADTLGAAIAVAMLGDRLGVRTEVVSTDVPGAALDGFPGLQRVRRRPELPPGLAVVCDAASLERIGPLVETEAAWLSASTVVNIDHHATNTRFGDVDLVMPERAATCEIVTLLTKELGVELDADLGTVLLAGIIRDTRGFADASTRASTLRLAADLVDAGADLPSVLRSMLADRPPNVMALWGRVLSAMCFAEGPAIVYAGITGAMLSETGTGQDDADGVVELMSSMRGVRVAILGRELAPESTRVSIRTAGDPEASAIAATFGGGGHITRAGCTIASDVPAALDRVVVRAIEAVTASAGSDGHATSNLDPAEA
jgi:phosphoesterase RecJ-like protein